MDDGIFAALTHRAGTPIETRIVVDACATPLGVREALMRLRARLGSWGLPCEHAGATETVVAEVMNNIVAHAYQGRGDARLQLVVDLDAKGLFIHAIDRGIAMPGGRLPEIRESPLDVGRCDLPEGGFGWAMIRQLTSDLDYRRVQGENHLRFRMRFARA